MLGSLALLEIQVSGEKIEKVFNHLSDGNGLSKESLYLASRTYYSVVSDIVITDQQGLEALFPLGGLIWFAFRSTRQNRGACAI